MSLLLLFQSGLGFSAATTPAVCLGAALLGAGTRTDDGILVEALSIPWFRILAIIKKDPEATYAIESRLWEEIIAGAYMADGFEVVLTSRCGDYDRHVIATRKGVGSIRICDKVRAYRPGHLVNADEARALAGILHGNVSKGVLTTTSDFTPALAQDALLAPLMSHRLELKPGSVLFPWLQEIAEKVDARRQHEGLRRHGGGFGRA